MPHRDYQPGYRGGPRDREEDEESFDRDREDRWRNEHRRSDRSEFSGATDYGRGRAGEWSERGYRGGARDGGFRDEWHGRGSYGRMNERNEYERGSERSSQFGTAERRSTLGWDQGESRPQGFQRDEEFRREGRQRDWSARDYDDREEFDYRGESSSGRGWGGAAAGYGPSTGYGYGTAGTYLGGPAQGYSEHERGERWGRAQRGQQSFVGRGPRSYKRSDERIKEDINERLTRHPDIDASDVEVRVSNCEVVLSGVVEDRRAKRLAEDIAEEVWGVDDVRNELKVRRGFLAALTGEQADEREVTRTATREGGMAGDRYKTGRSGTTTGSQPTTSPNPTTGT